MDTEIDNRIVKAGVILRELYRSVISKREQSNQAELSVFKSLYYPTLTYGHEIWVLNERLSSRVQAAEMRYLRGVAGVRRIDRVRNSVIRLGLGVEPLLQKVSRSQLRWFGHVLRMPSNRLVGQVYLAQPTGRRPRGRPRNRWSDGMRRLCERVGVAYDRVKDMASDRDGWRTTIAGLTLPSNEETGSGN